MKGWMVALAAASMLSLVPAKAEAGFCGVARYSCCAPCCQMQCHTVMKTVRCIEYEQQEVTCYKTCWERVCEDRVINCVKYVPETRTERSLLHGLQAGLGNQDPLLHGVQASAGKPRPARSATRCASRCWETKTRCYTVCKPVWETTDKQVCYTVCKPVWETKTRCYTVCKPVLGNQDPDCYTVCKPVLGNPHERDLLHGLQAGVGRPRPAATRCASRCGKPRTREDLLHTFACR